MHKRIASILREWKNESKGKGVIQFRLDSHEDNHSHYDLVICYAYPGVLIGKGGSLVDKYQKIITSEFSLIKSIKFLETDVNYIE